MRAGWIGWGLVDYGGGRQEQDGWESGMKAHWHQGVALAALLGLAGAPAAAQTMGGASTAGMSDMGAHGAGAGSMMGIQPGGEPGAGGVSGGGGAVVTGNTSADAAKGIHGDLGINDPFAAAGTGVGGPAPGDRAAGSVNDALTALPSWSLEGDAPAGAPGPGLDENGPPNPLAPLNNPLDPSRGDNLMIPPGLSGASPALPPPPGR